MRDWQVTFLKRIRKVASLSDQVMVSGGNFLTIAICAHALPLSEQGKFTYVFASYMGLLLLNVAGIFQGAAVRAPTQDSSYLRTLARLQIGQALMLSLTLCAVWWGAGNIFGWQATSTEIVLLLAFLVVQQLADFDRRTAYIFSNTKRAILSSALLYPGRIIALIIVRPDTVSQVLEVLIFSALIPAAITVYVASRSKPAADQSWSSAIRTHLVYSRLFIAGAPLGWLWSYTPIFMLGIMHGKEQAAVLASIRGISNIANVLIEQLETKVVADWARLHHGDGSSVMQAAARRLNKIGILFWLMGMLLIALFASDIVALILGDLYAPHWQLLVIGWIGYGVYFQARISGITYRALGASSVEFFGNVAGFLAALIAGYLLIPSQQATGAAWVYVIIAIAMWAGQKYSAIKSVNA
jgi:O-antigen/teichoic acid export membrane protein